MVVIKVIICFYLNIAKKPTDAPSAKKSTKSTDAPSTSKTKTGSKSQKPGEKAGKKRKSLASHVGALHS